MAHTGPRTSASVLNYHIGRMNELYSLENGVWVYHGERVDAKMAADMGDMMGGLNSSYNAQYPGVPFPSGPDEPNPGPTPPSGDPAATFGARAAIGQNCAWGNLMSDAELTWAKGQFGENAAKAQFTFYSGGGSGGMNVQERPHPTIAGAYQYVHVGWEDDVGGAADAHVLALATAQGRTVPPPLP